jgi:ribosomal protein L34E
MATRFLILSRERKRFEHLCHKVSTALKSIGVTRKKLLSTLPEARQRVFERRYGMSNRVLSGGRHRSRG